MHQTLFVIPHAWFEGPLLWVWLVAGFVWLVALYFQKGMSQALGFLPLYLIAAALIRFVFPVLQVEDVNPIDPQGAFVKSGLAVRGYGVCLLLGILAGIGLTIHRAKQIRVDPDLMVRLAVWMIVSGVVGARLFYIIQKHDEFFKGESLAQTFANLVDATKGGLVVYGSLIGGMIAALIFFRVTKLPVFRTADLIAPGMVLGLAIGRIGCLMNGCCFGGICDVEGLPRIHFPAGSPPYMQQLVQGELVGVTTVPIPDGEFVDPIFTRRVIGVQEKSLADQQGLQVGDLVIIVPIDDLRLRYIKSKQNLASASPFSLPVRIVNSNQVVSSIDAIELPDRSIGVHPAQIYSAVDAVLLCLLLWFVWYVRTADGQIFALMLILHGISRFLLEIVRQDEFGAFGTSLTISQWISILLIVLGIIMFGYSTLRRGKLSTELASWD